LLKNENTKEEEEEKKKDEIRSTIAYSEVKLLLLDFGICFFFKYILN